MIDLVEQILSENYVSANDLFEYRMRELAETKTIEMKKQLQAEAMGGMTKAEIEARRRMGWQKAADVLGDPRDKKIEKPKKKLKKKLTESVRISSKAYAKDPQMQQIVAKAQAKKQQQKKKVEPTMSTPASSVPVKTPEPEDHETQVQQAMKSLAGTVGAKKAAERKAEEPKKPIKKKDQPKKKSFGKIWKRKQKGKAVIPSSPKSGKIGRAHV